MTSIFLFIKLEEGEVMKSFIPPKLYLLGQIASVSTHFIFFRHEIFNFSWNLLGIIPLICGLWLAVSAKRVFAHAGTEINTFNSPTRLVQGHVYRFTRNPMYLGMLISLFGTPFLFSNPYLLFFPFLFYMVSSLWYIPFEEKMLKKEFTDEYIQYSQKVRRWV